MQTVTLITSCHASANPVPAGEGGILGTMDIYAAEIQMQYKYFTAAVSLIQGLSWFLAAEIKKPPGGQCKAKGLLST